MGTALVIISSSTTPYWQFKPRCCCCLQSPKRLNNLPIKQNKQQRTTTTHHLSSVGTRCLSSTIVKCSSSSSSTNNTQDDEEEEVKDVGVKAALSMLKFYKREISPLMPNSCRYVPTCSQYSMEAYKRYGVAKGTILTACRLCRCNPLGGSGFDPPRWFDEEMPSEE